jgi:uncharacterized delta-60 repeat protein
VRHFLKMIIVAGLFTACNSMPPSTSTFDITLSSSSLTVAPNSHSSITVNVSRLDGFAGDVTVGLDGNPSGFNATPITIPATAASGSFDLETTAAPGSSTNVNLRASGSSASNVIRTINVTVQPFTTTLLDSNLVIAPGGSVTTKVLIGRLGGFNDAVTVSLGGLPNGVTSSPITIPTGETSAILKILATSTALETISSANISVTTSSGAYSQNVNARVDVQYPPGAFDLSFGVNGVIWGDNLSSGANDWFVQPDGKVLVVGYSNIGSSVTVTRWNTDAALDSSFGVNGTVTLPSNLPSRWSTKIHQANSSGFLVTANDQPPGSTVAGKLQLWLIGANGVLDTNFGTNGTVTLADLTNNKGFGDAVVLPTGQIMVVGESGANGSVTTSQPLFRRLQANGFIDSSFGTGGDVLLGGIGTIRQNLTQAMLASDGSILGYGMTVNSGNPTWILGRINSSGAPIAGFGGGGIKWIPNVASFQNRVVEFAGFMYLLSSGSFSWGGGTTLNKLKADGSLDPSYSMTLRSIQAFDVLFGLDGAATLIGSSIDSGVNGYIGLLERHVQSGALDLSFGNSGKVVIPTEGTDRSTTLLGGAISSNRLTVFGLGGIRFLSALVKY